jgi:conjugal transfer mating pair stabilization protein TraG
VYDCSQDSTICNNLVAFMRFCPTARVQANQAMQSNTGISDFLQNNTNGVPNGQIGGYTEFYTATTDSNGHQSITSTATPCGQAGPQIYQAMANYIDGDTFTSDLLAKSSTADPDGPSTVSAANNSLNLLSGDIAATALSAQSLMTINTQSRDATMMNLVFSPIFRAAQKASLDQRQPAVTFTTLMTNARNKAMIDTAGEASLFESFMTNAMNAFSFLFIVLTPIVAIVAITMGLGGYKIYGAWFLMGVWSQSWLPVAAVLSYYVQTTFWNRLLAFASSSTMSPASIDNFYTQVSSTIYTGSTMIAATPIITLSLLTGSVYTMSMLAGKATGTGRDYMDTDRAAGDAYDLTNADAARKQVESMGLPYAAHPNITPGNVVSDVMAGHAAHSGAITGGDRAVAATISYGQGISSASKLAQQAQLQTSAAHQRVEQLQNQLASENAHLHSLMQGIDNSGQTVHQTGSDQTAGSSQSKDFETTNASTSSDYYGAKAGGSIGLKVAGIGGEIGGEVGHNHEDSTRQSTATGNQVSAGQSYKDGNSASTGSSWDQREIDQLSSSIKSTESQLQSAQNSYQQALSQSQSYAQEAQRTMQSGAQTSVNVADLATMAYQESDASHIGAAVQSAVYSDAMKTAQGMAQNGLIGNDSRSILNKAQDITNQTMRGMDFSSASSVAAGISQGVGSHSAGVSSAATAGAAALASAGGHSSVAESLYEKADVDRFISASESGGTAGALASLANGSGGVNNSPLNPVSGLNVGDHPAGFGSASKAVGAGPGGGGFEDRFQQTQGTVAMDQSVYAQDRAQSVPGAASVTPGLPPP